MSKTSKAQTKSATEWRGGGGGQRQHVRFTAATDERSHSYSTTRPCIYFYDPSAASTVLWLWELISFSFYSLRTRHEIWQMCDARLTPGVLCLLQTADNVVCLSVHVGGVHVHRLLSISPFSPPAGDGVLWRRFHHRPGKEHQGQLAEGGLDRLHFPGDPQGQWQIISIYTEAS